METFDGLKWVFPKCLKCKYIDGAFCKKYKGDRIDLPIDLFNCPGFENKEEKMFNLYDDIEVVESHYTNSIPSVFIEKGRTGTVVKILEKDNDVIYLVELHSTTHHSNSLEFLEEKNIKKI